LSADRLRIAIIGSGISGLTAAWIASRKHRVVLYEAENRSGGHTNTVDVDEPRRRIPVDTGFIVFNESNYPLFTRLLRQLGVAWCSTSMSFSVHCDRTGIEYNGTSLSAFFGQRRNVLRPRFWGLLRDILRFSKEARSVLGGDDATTVDGWTKSRDYGADFRDLYLFPLGSALWSCSRGRFGAFPIRFVVAFLDHHGMLDIGGRPTWRVVRGGSRTYVDRLLQESGADVRLASPVRSIARAGSGVRVRSDAWSEEIFDRAIVACHADQALAIIEDPTPAETEILSSFPYETNVATLHTDPRVLPDRRRVWASWNYRVPAVDSDRATVTYYMNSLQSIASDEHYCVTLNDAGSIDPSRVLRRITYQHPVFDHRRCGAQSRHAELADHGGVSYCGAYWGYGFHEDGVRSALAACRAIDPELGL
jgi:predicted NAD/FAD-binding protein